MKTKLALFILTVVFVYPNVFAFYYHNNDKRFRETILKNNIIKLDWTMQREKDIPLKLRSYSVTSYPKKDKEAKHLLPLVVLDIHQNNTFTYIWKKTDNTAGTVSGKWKVKNRQLILTLTKDYGAPYVKGAQLRYDITGTTNNNTILKLRGTKYPPVTGIIQTSNNPMNDFKKIVLAKAQAVFLKKSGAKTPTGEELATAKLRQQSTKEENGKIEAANKGIQTIEKLQMSIKDLFTLTSAPDTWDVDVMHYQPLKSADVLISPKIGNDFNIILHFRGELANLTDYNTPGKMKEYITHSAKKFLPFTNEDKISFESLPNKKPGFYTILTDKKLIDKKKIPAGKFKYVIKGMYSISKKSALEFTLMINQLNTEQYEDIMKYILSFNTQSSSKKD